MKKSSKKDKNNKGKNQNKKNSLLKRFFFTIFLTILIFFMCFVVAIAVVKVLNNKFNIVDNTKLNKPNKIVKMITKVPKRTTVLLLGVDEDNTRTDTIMLANFNSETGEVNIMSIPRDTYITLPKDKVEKVRSIGRKNIPKSGNMKINEINSYAGKDLGINYLESQIEDLLNLKIDYYVKINLDAFVKLVDTIGGVEFNVPVRMKHDLPRINLYPGLQMLDGKKAEQLIRFRGYREGDLKRIEVQQQFIKTVIEKTINSDEFIKNIPHFISIFLDYVDTDFDLTDMSKYISFVNKLSMDNLNVYTMPCTPEYINGVSYVKINQNEARDLVNNIFKG